MSVLIFLRLILFLYIFTGCWWRRKFILDSESLWIFMLRSKRNLTLRFNWKKIMLLCFELKGSKFKVSWYPITWYCNPIYCWAGASNSLICLHYLMQQTLTQGNLRPHPRRSDVKFKGLISENFADPHIFVKLKLFIGGSATLTREFRSVLCFWLSSSSKMISIFFNNLH